MNKFSGRGGGFSRPRRDPNEDPYGEAALESFIPEQRRREKDPKCTRLHVSNIPPTMSEVTLRQLFSEFGNPTIFLSNHVYPSTNKCWGFVDFDTYFEAQNAICALNKTNPHNLSIKFANNAEENSETEDFRKEIQPPRENSPPSFRGRGRGAHVPLMGRAPSSLQTKKPQTFENYTNDPEGDHHTGGYSSSKFRHDNTPSHIRDTNEVYDSVSKITRGMRSVTLGRGTYINDNVEKYNYPQVTAKVEQKLEERLLNKVLKPTKEDVRCYPPVSDKLPFETGRCPCCDRPSAYICCNCKKWYCSTDCVREHVAKCGTSCTRSTIAFETKCQGSNHVEGDTVAKKYEVEDSNQRPRNDNLRQSPKSNDINNRLKVNQHRGNNKKDNGKSGRSSFSSEEGGKRSGGNSNNNGQNRRSRNSGTRGYFTDVEDDNGSLSKMKTSNSNNNSNNKKRNSHGGGGDRKSGGGSGSDQGNRNHDYSRSKSYSRNSFDNRNNHDNDVYVRKDDMNTSAPLIHRADLPYNIEDEEYESGIGEPNEVLVTSVTNDKEVYWVCMKTSLHDQMETIERLNNIKSKIVTSPSVNSTFAAPFGDELYRAKVLSISGYNVKVLFIDYGNEASVPIEELKLLPLDLISKPPLAFKVRIVGCPRTLKDQEEVFISLRNKDSSGAWIAKLVDNSSSSRDSKDVSGKAPVKCIDEPPPISFDHFDTVHVMSGGRRDYFVQLAHNVVKLVRMGEQLGEFESIKVEPKLGEIYAAKYADIWCRAEVIELSPLTVFFVDYGNEERVKKEDLHPVPQEFRNTPGLAVKIRLDDGTPEEYFNLKMTESISVKAVDQLEDGTILVQVQGEKYDQVRTNKNDSQPKGVYSDKDRKAMHVLELVNKGETGIWVSIQKALSVECLSGFIITNTKSQHYCSTSDLSELLKNVEPARQFEPQVGDLVIARVGSTFCRGYVMMKTNDDINVALIDYGKVVSLQEKNLTLLPPRFHTYPVRQAVRVILKTPLSSDNYRTELIGNKVHLKNVEKVGNEMSLKCTFGIYNEAEILAWTPFVEEAGLRVVPIENNSPVTLASFHSPKSVYVNPASNKLAVKFAELLQDITAYIPKAERFNRKPLCGELVCARYKDDGNYYRAQLFEKAEDDSFKINFVDFGNTEVVSIDDMLPLPDQFKKVPCFAVKVGLKDIAGHNFNVKAVAYLNQLSMNGHTLLLMYDDNLGEVTLSEQDGRVINKNLKDLMEPSLISLECPSLEHVNKLHPFMGTDVTYESWEVNSRINIAIVAAVNHRTVLCFKEDSSLCRHIYNFLVPEITKYCKTADQKAYNPRANELILAKYVDDNPELEESKREGWYRAICIKPMMSSAFVLFIDYGNCGELKHSDIRSMPAKFMDTPAALKKCSFYGIVDDISAEVKEKIKDFYVNKSTTAIVLEDNENGNSTLWVPSFYEKLQEVYRHPPVHPPPGV